MKIENDKIIIETAEEAACFDNWPIKSGPFELEYWVFEYQPPHIFYLPIDAPKLREAITEKVGHAVFAFHKTEHPNASPRYMAHGDKWHVSGTTIAANALTVGKTVGELRRLLALTTETDKEES